MLIVTNRSKMTSVQESGITLVRSSDNMIYAVLTDAVSKFPFNSFTKMTHTSTYLYGLQALKINASSKEIEDIVASATGQQYLPICKYDCRDSKTITSGNIHPLDTSKEGKFAVLSDTASITNAIIASCKTVPFCDKCFIITDTVNDETINFIRQSLNDCEWFMDIHELVENVFEDTSMSVETMSDIYDFSDILLIPELPIDTFSLDSMDTEDDIDFYSFHSAYHLDTVIAF